VQAAIEGVAKLHCVEGYNQLHVAIEAQKCIADNLAWSLVVLWDNSDGTDAQAAPVLDVLEEQD